jgi:hypothetical protein
MCDILDFEARQTNQRSICLLCWLITTRTERIHHEIQHEKRGDYKNNEDKERLWASPKYYSQFALDSSLPHEEQETAKKIKRLAKKFGFMDIDGSILVIKSKHSYGDSRDIDGKGVLRPIHVPEMSDGTKDSRNVPASRSSGVWATEIHDNYRYSQDPNRNSNKTELSSGRAAYENVPSRTANSQWLGIIRFPYFDNIDPKNR